MATQKALMVQEINKPVVLVDRDIPRPDKGQVLLKVRVAGFNPHDQRSRDWGLLISDMLPYVLGKDVVGKVTEVGDGVTAYKIGDRIMSLADAAPGARQSGLQEYAIANVDTSCKVPDALSDDEAATIPTNLASVLIALFIVLGLPTPWSGKSQPTDRLLIVGGGSNCGKFATMLAKLAGIQKIVVVGGDEQYLRDLGATHVIDRHGSQDAKLHQIHDAVGDDLTYAFDVVNFPEGLGLALNALSSDKSGKLARLVPMGQVDESTRKGHEVLDVLGSMHYRDPICLQMFERLPDLIERGDVRPTPFNAVKSGLDPKLVNKALDHYRDESKIVKQQIHL